MIEMEKKVMRSKCFAIMLATVGIWMTDAYGYDRKAVEIYANDWSAPDGAYNSSIYYNYASNGGDCANFGSQCLNAGGIRFRADDASNTYPSTKSEKETGKDTRAIKDGDTKKYSRVIAYAQWLYESVTHTRHGGVPYNTNAQKADGGAAWSDVAVGDLVMKVTGGDHGHTMVVTNIIAGPDVEYCAHSSWRQRVALLSVVADWKTDQQYYVICFPDAPRIKYFYVESSNSGPDVSKSVDWRWDNRKGPGFGQGKPAAGKAASLWVIVTFDCDMKTNEEPTVKLLGDGFQPITFTTGVGEGYTNGWRTGATSGRFVQNRTWSGYISAASLPNDKNVHVKVSVTAKGADGSVNDADGALDKYNPGAFEAVNFQLDTRKAEGAQK